MVRQSAEVESPFRTARALALSKKMRVLYDFCCTTVRFVLILGHADPSIRKIQAENARVVAARGRARAGRHARAPQPGPAGPPRKPAAAARHRSFAVPQTNRQAINHPCPTRPMKRKPDFFNCLQPDDRDLIRLDVAARWLGHSIAGHRPPRAAEKAMPIPAANRAIPVETYARVVWEAIPWRSWETCWLQPSGTRRPAAGGTTPAAAPGRSILPARLLWRWLSLRGRFASFLLRLARRSAPTTSDLGALHRMLRDLRPTPGDQVPAPPRTNSEGPSPVRRSRRASSRKQSLTA